MNSKTIIFIFCVCNLVVMHSVGLYGLTHGQMQYYRDLTCTNLLITFGLFIVGGSRFDKNYLSIALIIAIIGFLIEVIGVKTKIIFGDYTYTDMMGPRFLDVPLVIGLNWAMLILACSSIVHKVYTNILLKAFIGATLMLLLDIVLEPIAYKYQYWQWDVKIVPLQNYIAWWLVSFALIWGTLKFLKNPENKMGYWVYGVQMLFFCLLNLIFN